MPVPRPTEPQPAGRLVKTAVTVRYLDGRELLYEGVSVGWNGTSLTFTNPGQPELHVPVMGVECWWYGDFGWRPTLGKPK
jgi:hypothetical protein